VGTAIEKLARRGLDAFNRRDRSAWGEVVDAEVVNVPPREWLEPQPVQGVDEVWAFWVDGTEPWGVATFELAELDELDGDRAVAHIRAEVEGRSSGAPAVWSFWQLLTCRNGRIARIDWFSEREEAFAAAGVAADAG
jgi:ketosteroid isomerase-like protein